MNSVEWKNDFDGNLSPAGKRVAVCLSGQARLFPDSIDSIKKHLIKPYGADVFCCFTPHTSWEEYYSEPVKDRLSYSEKVIQIAKDAFGKSLKTVQVLSEEDYPLMKSGATFTEETIDIIRWSKENNKPNIHPRNKKMELCSGLRRDWERQNNFQYDIVITLRPSLLLKEKLEIDFSISENTLITAGSHIRGTTIPRVWDGIFYTKGESHERATSDLIGSFPYLSGVKEEPEVLFEKLRIGFFMFSPENTLLYNWVMRKNFDLKFLKLPFSYIHPNKHEIQFTYEKLKPPDSEIRKKLPQGLVVPEKYRDLQLMHLYK